jgi:membrane protein DedA with SNARE-associated domain
MGESIDQINHYLDYAFMYGPVLVYAAIFAACFIENIAPPFPGDTFIVVAGGLAALGRLDWRVAFMAVIVGGISSIMLYYYLGRHFGHDYFRRKNFRFFTIDDIDAVEDRFHRYGALLLVVSRFALGFRVVLAVAAGIGRYPAFKMFLYTLISYILFTGLLMFLGYKLVEHLDAIALYFRTYNYIVWPLVLALVVWWAVRRYRRIRERKKT